MSRRVIRREASDLMRVFSYHWNADGHDLDAALRAVYELGGHDMTVGRRPRSNRAKPLASKSDSMRQTVARALPFVGRIARGKKMPTSLLVNGSDATTARERQEALYVLRGLPGRPFSFPTIAAAFGKKDHTTVMAGCKKVEERIALDPGLGARLRNLTKRVGATA